MLPIAQFSLTTVLDGEHFSDAVIPDCFSSQADDWFLRKQRKGMLHGAPLSASVFNLLNATMGCGILGLPLAFAQMGAALALAAQVVMTLLNIVTSVAMVRVGRAEGTLSYDNTVAKVLGRRALHAFQATLIMGQLGYLLSYYVLIGDFATYGAVKVCRVGTERPSLFNSRGVCAVVTP